jgi:hypothetical protein
VAPRPQSGPGQSLLFSGLFEGGVTLRRLVATFLAMLELTRIKKLRLRQHEAFADIYLDPVPESPPAAEPAGDAAIPAGGTADPVPAAPAVSPGPEIPAATADPATATAAPRDPPAVAAGGEGVAAPALQTEKPLETSPNPPTVTA